MKDWRWLIAAAVLYAVGLVVLSVIVLVLAGDYELAGVMALLGLALMAAAWG